MEQRAVIHFFYLRELPNKDIHDLLVETYGDSAVELRTVQRWTRAFREGKIDLDDEPRVGRPKINGLTQKISSILSDNEYISQKSIAKALGVDAKTVHSCLTEGLGLRKVNFKWIPHVLNFQQKMARIEISKNLLDILKNLNDKDWRNLFTGDETWIYMDNPRSSVWQRSDIARPTRPKQIIGAKKIMITVFWSRSGMEPVTYLPPGDRFNRVYFINEVMEDLEKQVSKRRPKKKLSGTFLHIDNARPHLINDYFESKNISRLPQPPYSPDIAPSDFFLFGYLKMMLEGHSFESPDECFAEVCKILFEIPNDLINRVFDEWMSRLQAVIERGGDYLT